MDNNQVVSDVVQKQATVGDIITDHINGLGGYAIAEKYGLNPDKVRDIIAQADIQGKFIPPGVAAPIDRVEDAPIEPLVEGENPAPVSSEPVSEENVTKSGPKASTKNQI